MAATPPAGYNLLKTLNVVQTSAGSMWAGAGNGSVIEAPATILPWDTTQTFNSLNSLRINVTTGGGWWDVVLNGAAGWETYNLTPYQANGFLEFNVKGNAGGEQFMLGLKDRVKERATEQALMPASKIANTTYVNVTTSWQHVKIPLTAFVPVGTPASTFDLNQVFVIDFSNSNANTEEFWINDVKYTSTDKEPSYPGIKVNQLGYTTQAEKYALVSGFQEVLTANAGTAFTVKRTSDGTAVFNGTLTLVNDYDSGASGERVLKADFTSLTTAGTYVVSVAATGVADSLPFQIGDNLYGPLLIDSMRYFYYQRQGIALDSTYAGTYTHGVGHPQDAQAQLHSNAGNVRDEMKGWYDAGDYGKYTNAGATAVSDLLWTYETFPAQFSDNQYNIPESGNGIPDILDEAKWELDWMLKMQDSASGGMYHMIQPTTQGSMPDADTATRYIEDVDSANGRTNVRPTDDAASAAAVFAEASIKWKSIDATYSNTLLTAAQNAWTYLVANPTQIIAMSGPYVTNDDTQDRLWAAAALYRATGQATYNTYFLANYQKFTGWDSTTDNAYFVGQMAMIGFLDYMKSASPDATAASWFTTKFNGWRTMMLNRCNTGAWRNCLPDNYYWGSNMPVLNTTKVLAVGSKILGTYDSNIINAARASLNYVLGINPIRHSYVSGYGSDSTSRIFSNIYSADLKPGIPKGYISGGANSQNNPLLFSRFPAKDFLDSDSGWTTNENAIYWNSSLVFNAALDAQEIGPAGPTSTPTLTKTAGPSPTPTNTLTPTKTFTPTATFTASNTALPTNTAQPGLSVLIDKGGGIDNTQETTFNFEVKNTGSAALSGISTRIDFTTDGSNAGSGYVMEKYYDQSGVATISGPTLACGSTYYFTVSYGTTSLAANGQWEFQSALHLSSWASTYSGANDWYHTGYAVGALPAAYTATNNIPAYLNGALAWGSTPSCGGATNTPTFVPPSATSVPPSATPIPPTKTNTPIPTVGPSNTPVPPTKTNTPIPGTPTLTKTPVPPSNTPVPPTKTNTPIPTVGASNTPVPPTKTNTPVPTTAPTNTPNASDPCSSPTVITGGDSFSVTTAGTCFKYVNTSFVNGGMFSVMKDGTSATDTLKWYGGTDQNVTACSNQSATISGNGGQLNNFVIEKDANGQMFLTVTGSASNSVTISIQNWQNGAGCSAKPTMHP